MNHLFVILVLYVFPKDTIQATPTDHLNRRRILQGNLAKPNQFPWHAALNCCKENYRNCMPCGGSLISPRFILTSNDCTNEKTHFDIQLGTHDRLQPLVQLTSTEKIQHPNWNNPGVNDNNIALIKLSEDVQLSEAVQVIKLSNRANLVNQDVILSGFGRTVPDGEQSLNLKYLGLRIIHERPCAIITREYVPFTGMCASSDILEQNLCDGDFGGPLVMKEGDSFVQVGISIMTYKNCRTDNPSMFTKVARFVKWIQENTGIKF